MKRKTFFNRLNVRLALLFFAVIILPSALAIGILGKKMHDDFKESILQFYMDELNIKASRISSLLEMLVGEIQGNADHFQEEIQKHMVPDRHLKEGLPTQSFYNSGLYLNMAGKMKQTLKESTQYLILRVFLPNGQELIRLNRTGTGIEKVPIAELQNKAHRNYFRHILEVAPKDVHVHDITLQKENGKIIEPHVPMIRVARKIMLEDGSLFAILVLNINADFVLGSFKQDGRRGFLIMDQGGNYLRHWNKKFLYNNDLGHGANLLDEEPELRVNLENQSSRFHYDLELKELRVWKKVFYDRHDKSRYWVLMERHYEADIVSPWFSTARDGLIRLAAVLSIGFLLFIALSQRVLRPLSVLSDGIRKIEIGDLSTRIKVKSETEISEIADAFNNMAARLEITDMELRRSMAMEGSITEIAPNAHILINEEGIILKVNPATCKTFGYDAEEIIGEKINILMPPPHRELHDGYLKRYLNAGTSKMIRKRTELVALRKDGKTFPIAIYLDEVKVDSESIFIGIMEDLTERKEWEVNMLRMEKSLEQADFAVTMTDIGGTINYVNPAFTKLTGYSAKEAIGANTRILKSGHHPEELFKKMWDTLLAGKVWRGEIKNRRKDGTLYDVMQVIAPVETGRGIIDGYVGIQRDITDEKKVKENLLLTQMTMDSSLEAIYWVARDGNLLYVNNAACKKLGYSRDELLTKTVFDISVGMMPDHWKEHWSEIVEKHHFTLEAEHKKKNGKTFPVEIGVNLVNIDGEMFNCAFVRDITERKVAEKALKESEEKHRAIFEHASDSIILTDPETVEIVAFNTSAFESLGYTRGEFEKLAISDLNADVSQEEIARHIKQIAKEGHATFERRHRKKNGEIRHSLISAKYVSIGGRNLIQAIVRDITEQKRAEKEILKAKEAAEEANMLKSQFIAKTNHELRGPLTSIIGYIKLLLDEKCEDREEAKEFLENAYTSSILLRELINDLLDIGAIESDKVRLSFQTVSLKTVLQQVKSITSLAAKDRGLELNFDCSCVDNGHQVYCDPARLKQVIVNLVSNAIKFTERGAITTSCEPSTERGLVAITITDTGIGLPPGGPDIFEPFVQLDGKRFGGTGLGLAIAKRLVEKMGGSLRLSSKGLGLGTTATIVMPEPPDGTGG